MTDYRGRGLPAYTVGTISGSSGSTTVTGASTAWISTDSNGLPFNQVGSGDTLVLPGGADEISIKAVLSATSLELERPLPAAISGGTAYRIVRRAPNPTGYLNKALTQLEDRMDGIYADDGNKLVVRTVSGVLTLSLKAPVTGSFSNYISLAPNGCVGVKTITPKASLHATGTGVVDAPTLGSISAALPFFLTGADQSYGLAYGFVVGSGAAWMQAQRADGGTSAYAILLNPAGGNVGIGTASPSQKLTVAAETNQLALTTGAVELIARASASEVALYTFQNVPIVFYNNNAERMRITASGNVGIGTAAPSTTLHANGPIRCGSFTVATVPSASTVGAGTSIYVSDETGGAVMAFSDGTNWRRVTDRAVIS